MRQFLFLVCFFFLICSSAFSQEYGHLVVAQVRSVYDGDTFRADINNLHPIIGENIPIRISGVDTPEIRGKCDSEKKLALEARDFVKNKLLVATKIELRNIQRGKYFRMVADVYIDGVNIADLLLSERLVHPYSGGKKQSWCQ